jgi:hypothetical protein
VSTGLVPVVGESYVFVCDKLLPLALVGPVEVVPEGTVGQGPIQPYHNPIALIDKVPGMT